MTTVGSLCSGIGGLDLAVERFFDAELIWHSDICDNANRVMHHHWEYSEPIGDLTKVDAAKLVVPDIITCGFPCQPVSTSGLLAGTKSDKWLFDDIVAFLCSLNHQPKKVIFENVSNLLSHDQGKTGRYVINQIADIGFDVRWQVLRAADAGLPHSRKRFFAIATHTDSEPGKEQDIRACEGEREIRRFYRKPFNDLERSGLPMFTTKYGALQPFHEFSEAIEAWEVKSGEPAPNPISKSGKAISEEFVRWMMGFPPEWLNIEGLTRTAKLQLLGNAVCPQQALLAFESLERKVVNV